ncbi:MAG: ATP-binding protein, partial [Caldilineaceae bacterium]|nr:ATP-binding protein [Caldilineaceae bacterium]
MISKHFADIEKSDIDALLENAVSESRTLDYKEKLPSNSNDDRKEFLADVISFANAGGGDLIFGVREQRDAQNKQTGFPESIIGLAGINTDNEILRLESILRDSVDPRLPSVQTRAIPGFTEGPVIIIRVAQSWTSPHRSKQDRHFYSRTSAGKYPMDVGEIRSAFALSSNLADAIRQFRDDRLARIIADETPVLFGDKARMVLYLIPQSSMMPSTTVNIQSFIDSKEDRQFLRPIYSAGGWSGRYNYEGYTSYT